MLVGVTTYGAETNSTPDRALLRMSLEQLMGMKVTSVSKREEVLSRSAAAISVITPDDIRRSGVENIPDALRLAPGVDVGRVDSHSWAVGVRGMNELFSPSILPLIDGRSIYSPFFSGTFWMAQDVMLEDLSRIEVVRGPGSTLWGANAFNGVINIVSKPAEETQGLLVNAGGGSQPTVSSSVRWGDKLGEDTFYRVYGKYNQYDDLDTLAGDSAGDHWWKTQGGFRVDHKPGSAGEFTLQGDVYYLNAYQALPVVSLTPPSRTPVESLWEQGGANLLGRWTRTFSEKSQLTVQTYYDGERLDLPQISQTRHTFDLDIRHQLKLGERHEIVWGGGYRFTGSSFGNTAQIQMLDSTKADSIFNAFAQDQINLIPERVVLTIGSKLEHNDYTGFEVEPGARIAWTPTDRQTIWASVSRAVRTPSQFEDGIRLQLAALPAAPPATPPQLITLSGNRDFNSEVLVAYELGYRVQPHPRLTLDFTAFVNSYDGLRDTPNHLDPSTLPGYLKVIAQFHNGIRGETYGGETAATWQPRDDWRLTASYSILENHLESPPDALTGQPQSAYLKAPEQQFAIRSSHDLTAKVTCDLWLRYVGRFYSSTVVLPGDNFSPQIESYFSLDARIAWQVTKNLELSLVGQNLLEEGHREFNPTYLSMNATRVPRSVFGKVTWRF